MRVELLEPDALMAEVPHGRAASDDQVAELPPEDALIPEDLPVILGQDTSVP